MRGTRMEREKGDRKEGEEATRDRSTASFAIDSETINQRKLD